MIKKVIAEDTSGREPLCNAFYFTFISWLFIPSIAADDLSYLTIHAPEWDIFHVI